METDYNNKPHIVTIDRRKSILITGVKEVVSFDTKEITLDTTDGSLTVKGQDMHVNNLDIDNGKLCVEGTIDELSYSNKPLGEKATKEATKSILERWFK